MSQPPSRLLAAVLASDEIALRPGIGSGDDINAWDELGIWEDLVKDVGP